MASKKSTSEAKRGPASEKVTTAQVKPSRGAAADSADAAKDQTVPAQEVPSISIGPENAAKDQVALTSSEESAPSNPFSGSSSGLVEVPEMEALFVRSRSKTGFRRCGYFFPPDGVGISLDSLSDEDIDTLKGEPNLVVEEVTITQEDC